MNGDLCTGIFGFFLQLKKKELRNKETAFLLAVSVLIICSSKQFDLEDEDGQQMQPRLGWIWNHFRPFSRPYQHQDCVHEYRKPDSGCEKTALWFRNQWIHAVFHCGASMFSEVKVKPARVHSSSEDAPACRIHSEVVHTSYFMADVNLSIPNPEDQPGFCPF